MTEIQERKAKRIAMDELIIPFVIRSAFMRFANKWGRFGLYNSKLWYEYSPLERRQKQTMTMKEMWDKYIEHSL